uniref:replication protein n=1 Tax=Streptococcus suis TaxID=1307 RepID=UPI001F189AA7|nr:replication protein [Streptococcus suis]
MASRPADVPARNAKAFRLSPSKRTSAQLLVKSFLGISSLLLLLSEVVFFREILTTLLKDFADYCMSDRAPAGWFELLTERNTLFIKEYIKSNWQKENQVYKE